MVGLEWYLCCRLKLCLKRSLLYNINQSWFLVSSLTNAFTTELKLNKFAERKKSKFWYNRKITGSALN